MDMKWSVCVTLSTPPAETHLPALLDKTFFRRLSVALSLISR